MSTVVSALWISCPRCSRRARTGQPFCELCGFGLLKPEERKPETPQRSAHCESCGATVLIPENERTATCAFCGAPYVAASEAAQDRMRPEFVLPFAIKKADAQQSFKVWIGRSGWFTPRDLSIQSRMEELRGVYIPFWSFSMRSESDWSAQIGEHWYETVVETYTTTENGKTVTRTRTRQVQHTEWYPLSGRFHQFHSHYLVSASNGLPQGVADAVGPFPVEEVTRYAPHFLSGWLCEEYSVARDEAAQVSAKKFEEQERQAIAAFLPGDCHSSLQVATQFFDTTEDLILLPIWIFAYTYHGKTFRYVLNGATGKQQGDKPVSGARIAILVLLVILVAALVVSAVAFLSRR